MEKDYLSIKEFLKSKEYCIFCNKPLKAILTNFIGKGKQIPIISSKLENNQFNFDINYYSSFLSLKTKCSIDIETNDIVFNPISENLTYTEIIDIFESFKPHIEIICNNKLCHMNYYLCSSILKCNRNLDHKIKPMNICFEACNVNKFWIQNDFFKRKTSIYSTNNININPIIIPILNFNDFTETKLRSRILTTVTFQ